MKRKYQGMQYPFGKGIAVKHAENVSGEFVLLGLVIIATSLFWLCTLLVEMHDPIKWGLAFFLLYFSYAGIKCTKVKTFEEIARTKDPVLALSLMCPISVCLLGFGFLIFKPTQLLSDWRFWALSATVMILIYFTVSVAKKLPR